MRQFIYHCRRIKRRLYEIAEYSDLTDHERTDIGRELANYEKFMQEIDIHRSDYFFLEFCEIYDMLETMMHGG